MRTPIVATLPFLTCTVRPGSRSRRALNRPTPRWSRSRTAPPVNTTTPTTAATARPSPALRGPGCVEDGAALLATHDDALRAAQALLDGGSIIAVKGLGGYHLMCSATDAAAVARLRERKRRGAKPFAVLVASPADIADAAIVSAHERAALESPQRPIVLLRRLRAGQFLTSHAPRS
jgi:hypothetical protein